MDNRVMVLSLRSLMQWIIGSPEVALKDAERAVDEARKLAHVATLAAALGWAGTISICCGNYTAGNTAAAEIIGLTTERGAAFWKDLGLILRGWLQSLTGDGQTAIQTLNLTLTSVRSAGATAFSPLILSNLAWAHAKMGQSDDAWQCINEAIAVVETTGERWWEAEVHRMAGEIALMSKQPDAAESEACFERAIPIARRQQAKSFELRGNQHGAAATRSGQTRRGS
jgi:predicted ATPase